MSYITTLKIDLGERQYQVLTFAEENPDLLLEEFVSAYPARFPGNEFEEHKHRRLSELVFEPVIINDEPRTLRAATDSLWEEENNLTRTAEKSLRIDSGKKLILIEDTSGEQYACEVPTDTTLAKLANDFFEDRGWPTTDSHGQEQRAVIELVDPENHDRTKRLRNNHTVDDAGLRDGDTLRIFPVAVAGCFLADVKITLADGEKRPIRDIEPGHLVRTGMPGSREFGSASVEKVFVHQATEYLSLNQRLNVTASHPIFTNGKWVRAGDLKIGNVLQNENGEGEILHTVQKFHREIQVYNIHVSLQVHTFFAGNILVHNKILNQEGLLDDFVLALRKRPSPQVIIKPAFPYKTIKIILSLPPLLSVNELFHSMASTLQAADNIHATSALLFLTRSEARNEFIKHLSNLNGEIFAQSLPHFLAQAEIEPLRILSLHYGSPASVDFLGLGKVLEILVQFIKDVSWRWTHERELARLERENKRLELARTRMALESAALAHAEKKLEFLEESNSIMLTPEHRRVIAHAIYLDVLEITQYPITCKENPAN